MRENLFDNRYNSADLELRPMLVGIRAQLPPYMLDNATLDTSIDVLSGNIQLQYSKEVMTNDSGAPRTITATAKARATLTHSFTTVKRPRLVPKFVWNRLRTETHEIVLDSGEKVVTKSATYQPAWAFPESTAVFPKALGAPVRILKES